MRGFAWSWASRSVVLARHMLGCFLRHHQDCWSNFGRHSGWSYSGTDARHMPRKVTSGPGELRSCPTAPQLLSNTCSGSGCLTVVGQLLGNFGARRVRWRCRFFPQLSGSLTLSASTGLQGRRRRKARPSLERESTELGQASNKCWPGSTALGPTSTSLPQSGGARTERPRRET